ncbi:hypothetical protein K493DRAFT_237436 [Basidiobolus meristosporus CBS 931.73]|uniref:Uncharacterized protein n=1 Tax=Basidiobolus meristosporus CBS 931.73 TaxID=1314790 RepID=A0A1Y1XNV5_9FUNG|nr:hypothetical protein K493DRAFT_237436 [Basidiobolus meristosporus CBS 931.73]|eukprot:ORX87437.1 hypothetical protein K493DRAFT_237436 [Basidiobolus meristosporus CBS 931.73]
MLSVYPSATWAYRHSVIDPVVEQPLPYDVDRITSLTNLECFMERYEEKVEEEVAWLTSIKANLVVSDAPFLPCAAARRCNVPCVIASNFTFDKVYEGLLAGDAYDKILHKWLPIITNAYKQADTLLRMPGFIEIPAFPSSNDAAVIDTPLFGRRSRLSKMEVLKSFGLAREDAEAIPKVLLIAFGGHSMKEEKWSRALPDGWVGIVCGINPAEYKLPANFVCADRSTYVPDLVNCSDVVLGKLGFGTCTECILHRKPMLFVSRPAFIEEPGLLSMMQQYGVGIEIPRDNFERGDWQEFVLNASEATYAESDVTALSGDEFIAKKLLALGSSD